MAWLNPCGTCVERVWNLWNYACLNPRNAWNPWNPMRLTGSTGSRNSLGSRNAKVPGQRAPQVPPVPPPSVPDFRGREMLHQVQAQRLKPNCMAVGNFTSILVKNSWKSLQKRVSSLKRVPLKLTTALMPVVIWKNCTRQPISTTFPAGGGRVWVSKFWNETKQERKQQKKINGANVQRSLVGRHSFKMSQTNSAFLFQRPRSERKAWWRFRSMRLPRSAAPRRSLPGKAVNRWAVKCSAPVWGTKNVYCENVGCRPDLLEKILRDLDVTWVLGRSLHCWLQIVHPPELLQALAWLHPCRLLKLSMLGKYSKLICEFGSFFLIKQSLQTMPLSGIFTLVPWSGTLSDELSLDDCHV